MGQHGAGGRIDLDKVSKALLQYLKIFLWKVDNLPVQLATGCQQQDRLLVHR